MLRRQDQQSGLARRAAGIHRAFTLIELLVVIALITILAGILFPVFGQVRERARQTVCLSNMRQISTGMQMYLQDYDDRFPPVVSREPGDRYFFSTSWMSRLAPHVKDMRIFLDPSSGNTNPDWRASSDLLYNYGYAPSARVWGSPGAWQPPLPVFRPALWEGLGGFAGRAIGFFSEEVSSYSTNHVARPAETILICDHEVFDWGISVNAFAWPAPRHMREGEVRLPNGESAPEGLINCVFVDGHVKALKHSQFWEVLPRYSHRFGEPHDVYRHFWPLE